MKYMLRCGMNTVVGVGRHQTTQTGPTTATIEVLDGPAKGTYQDVDLNQALVNGLLTLGTLPNGQRVVICPESVWEEPYPDDGHFGGEGNSLWAKTN